MSERSQELVEAISATINQQPFFAAILFDMLKIEESEAIPTACTDGRRLIVNPKFFKKHTVPERVYILCHEVCHVIFQHPGRARTYHELGAGPDLNPWNHGKFNRAADYNINDYLNKIGVGKQPLGTLLNGQYGMDDVVDDIYCKLPDEPEDECGGGGWDTHEYGDPNNEPSTAEIQRAVKMGEGAAKAMGKENAFIKRLIDEVIEPDVRWEDHLAKTIFTMHGSDEQTWSRPNRRRLSTAPHIYWPGKAGRSCAPIALILDTSGSMGDKELAVGMGVTKGILQQCVPEKIYAMYIDAKLFNDEVIEIDDLSQLDELRMKAGGGGGTDMTVGFREIEERQLDVHYCIVFTDGFTPFGEDTGIPTIWCITSPDITAPWGETIHVKLN